MDTTTLNSMCRCCAAEGMFKDIKTSYHWMGEEEVYGDMLRECFDVKLVSVEDGGICEVCITQLRNASNFKKQVLHTEKKFKRILDSRQFKPTEVKEEVSGDENSSSEDNENDRDVDNDNIDDEDYVPDFEMPIKTESPEESKSRKRGAKATTSRAKKSRVADDEDKSKEQADKHKVLAKQRYNVRQILLSTNATPIKRHDDLGYACCFCTEQFQDPADLKTHTLQTHDDSTKATFMQKAVLMKFLVKLDVTDLGCNLCGESIDSFLDLVAHLNGHAKNMYTDIKNYILPFKFDGDVLSCTLCSKVFQKFKTLQEHMYEHFKNFECATCGAGFVNRRMLHMHDTNSHKVGSFPCSHCPDMFDTFKKKKSHEYKVHAEIKLYKCRYCDLKFRTFESKAMHLRKMHGIGTVTYDCSVCDRSFTKPSLVAIHVKKDHLREQRYKCSVCDKAYFYKYRLDLHSVSHTLAKDYKCEICDKNFASIKSLREHIKIHTNDRRFKCQYCDMAFLQKITLKKHLERKHDE